MSDLVHGVLWANVEAAIWAAALLLGALVVHALLRGRLPAWRKGLWLTILFLPFAFVLVGMLSPAGRRSWLVPTDWAPRVAGGRASSTLAWLAPALAAGLYGLWVVGCLLEQTLASLRLRRVLNDAMEVVEPEAVAIYTRLVRAMGCARAPRLLSSGLVASPFIVASPLGGMTIVVPEALLAAEGSALAGVLAHELAHARAGDPWIQRMMFPVKCFFPLAWLAASSAARLFWEDAAETTCDLRALRGSGLGAKTYAVALRDVALAPSGAAMPATMGMRGADLSPASRRLTSALIRRIRALPMAGRWSEELVQGLGAASKAIIVSGALLLLCSRTSLGSMLAEARPARPANVAQQLAHAESAAKAKTHKATPTVEKKPPAATAAPKTKKESKPAR